MIFLVVALLLCLHNILIWLWYRYTNNPSVVDVGWAAGLTLSGLVYLNHSEFTLRSLVLSFALLIWGVRLGGYLWYTRIRYKQIDQRYITLSKNWKISKSLGFFLNFQLQGIFIYIISIPWYFSSLSRNTDLSLLDALGLLIFTLAVVLESASDIQLNSFKKIFPGQVCDQKLWRYSRHPNYFFEWLAWCAFSLFSLSSHYGWISIVSPLLLYILMTRITIPLTEQGSIQSKGKQYIEYQRLTPQFFPKFLSLLKHKN